MCFCVSYVRVIWKGVGTHMLALHVSQLLAAPRRHLGGRRGEDGRRAQVAAGPGSWRRPLGEERAGHHAVLLPSGLISHCQIR